MIKLDTMLQGVGSVVILGHIRPDGDCVGSCLGTYNYLMDNYPQIEAAVYLEPVPEKFKYLQYYDRINHECTAERAFDLCICLDSGDKGRFGKYVKYLDGAKNSICIDHHITNTQFAQENILKTDASSTCEVLYGLMDPEKVSKETAECIYTGIVHDTGVFKFTCTSRRTMEIAGELMEKGIDFTSIIDDSFYKKSYIQNQILGRALLESMTFLHGACIFSVIREKDMQFYGVQGCDMDGIIDQLRVTEGVECAVFMYETGNHEYKVSMRSIKIVDVSKIACYFGGGGHVRAAGCTMTGSIYDVINNLSSHIEKQLGQEQ